MISGIPITERRLPATFPAVGNAVNAPKGLGRGAYEPLMKKRRANEGRSKQGTAGNTFAAADRASAGTVRGFSGETVANPSPLPLGELKYEAVMRQHDFGWSWHWRTRLPERKGQLCRVLIRGGLNSALVQFLDGVKVVTSRYAIRKVKA